MLPPFTLPSNPERTITLREATVADAIDFCGADPAHEERVTTLFLNRVQDPAGYLDSATWTAADRRLALYWYWVHTESETDTVISYVCPDCGERRKARIEFKTLAAGYRQLQGKPERQIEFLGERVTVKPLTGVDMEALESMALEAAILKDAAQRQKQAEMRVSELARKLSWPDRDATVSPANIVRALSVEKFRELSSLVDAATEDMAHGLPSTYDNGRIYLLAGPVQCKECHQTEGEGTLLRIPFRNIDYVPRV